MKSKSGDGDTLFNISAIRVMKVGSLSLLCVCHQFTVGSSFATSLLRRRSSTRFPNNLSRNTKDGNDIRDDIETQTTPKQVQRRKGSNRLNIPKTSPRPSRSIFSSYWYQREELVRHDILTREDETKLAYAIVRAKQIREQITVLRQEKEMANFNGLSPRSEHYFDTHQFDGDLDVTNIEEDNIFSDEIDFYDFSGQLGPMYGRIDSMEEVQTAVSRVRVRPRFTKPPSVASVVDAKKLNVAAMYADLNDLQLTDSEIVQRLQISGGRIELLRILHSGSEARTELMRSNIRLVVSIAKKWIRKGIGHTHTNNNLMALYDGGWDRPGFDDIMQEGVLGLARAVDKYDPSRGLRFSTYSSYWITNYIRQLFQACTTGSLKIPPQLHEYKVGFFLLFI